MITGGEYKLEAQTVGRRTEEEIVEVFRRRMKELWEEAANAFESICGNSLMKGEIRSFQDVEKKIESSGKASYDIGAGQDNKW